VSFDPHCGRPGCRCAHAYGCTRGWIDHTDHAGNDRTQPCEQCRPDLARRVKGVPPPGMRNERDLAVLRNADRGEGAA